MNRCGPRWRTWPPYARSGPNDGTVPGRSDRVVVVGAGLAGLSAALHLAGRGREVTVVERESWPGGRAGRLDVDGYRIDTGPTVLTMPDIIDETFAAVGESSSGANGFARRRSGLPRAVRRRQQHRRAQRRGSNGRRDRGVRRRQAGRGLPAAAGLADPVVPHRIRRIHRQELRFPTVAAESAVGETGGDRRIPQMGCDGQAPHHRPAAATSVYLPVAVCRCGAAAGAGGLRGDRLHGHHLGSALPARRHAGAARCVGRRRDRCRRAIPLRRDGHRAGMRRRPGCGGPHRPGSAHHLRRGGADHRTAADLQTAGPRTAPHRHACGRRRRRLSFTSAVPAGRRRIGHWHITTSCSAQHGTRHSPTSSATAG